MAHLNKGNEWFIEKVKNYHGDKVELLSEYYGSEKKIDILYHCEEHGDTYSTLNAKNICKSYFLPCKGCQSNNKSNSAQSNKKNKDFYYKRLQEYCISRGGTVLTEKWTRAKDMYSFKCGNDNHPIFYTTADALYAGNHWCPYCSGRSGDFKEEITEIINSKNGELLSDYKNSGTHVRVRCKTHNHEWNILPNNIKKGRWCPVCNLPFSERILYEYLLNNGYNVQIQYTFDDLMGLTNEKLKFDFAIMDKNNKLLWLLELDDNSHFSKCQSDRYIRMRGRDKMKNDYCTLHNIYLFRMYYPFKYGSDQPEEQTYINYIENEFKQNFKYIA